MKNNYCKFLGTACALFVFVFLGNAQVDSKYLQGAVPEVNGKVVFSDTLSWPEKSQTAIFEHVLNWAKANFNDPENRVAYIDKGSGTISCRGKHNLVFSSSTLSLDQAMINYQLNIFCTEKSYRVEMKSISYDYKVSSNDKSEKYYAEKWITDKEAVNKDKLYRLNGKFRIKTIDLFDAICNSLYISQISGKNELFLAPKATVSYDRKSKKLESEVPLQTASASYSANPTPGTPVAIVASASGSQADQKGPSGLAGYRKMDPDKIPGNIIKQLTNDWMLITAGNKNKFNMMTAGWGGLGVAWEKPVSFCFIKPSRYTWQLMESGDVYTLSFYTEAYRDALKYCGSSSGKDTDKVKGSGLTPLFLPSGAVCFQEAWLIIECKKTLSHPIQNGEVKDEKLRTGSMPSLYIGEITNVWVK